MTNFSYDVRSLKIVIMEKLHPNDLFHKLRGEIKTHIIDITGSFAASDDTGMMLYLLMESDPGFKYDKDFSYPEVFTEKVRKYDDYPEIYKLIHLKYPYAIESGMAGGKTEIDPSFDSLENLFVDLFLDKGFSINLIKQRTIEKKHWKLKEETGVAKSLFGIFSKEELAFSFHCICGYISETDIKYLYNPQTSSKGVTPGFIFNCSGRLNYSTY